MAQRASWRWLFCESPIIFHGVMLIFCGRHEPTFMRNRFWPRFHLPACTHATRFGPREARARRLDVSPQPACSRRMYLMVSDFQGKLYRRRWLCARHHRAHVRRYPLRVGFRAGPRPADHRSCAHRCFHLVREPLPRRAFHSMGSSQ